MDADGGGEIGNTQLLQHIQHQEGNWVGLVVALRIPSAKHDVLIELTVAVAIGEGHGKVVAVLTRDRTYRRKETQGRPTRAAQAAYYRHHPEMKDAARRSPGRYNEERDAIFRLEQEGRVFVIAPSEPVTVGRFENDLDALVKLYRMGYRDAENALDALRTYLDS